MEELADVKLKLSSDWEFLGNVYKILHDGGVFNIGSNEKVVEFIHPEELKKNINLNIEEDVALSEEELINLSRQIIKYSVKTNHSLFRNQLFGQMDPYGLAGTWISESLNTSAYTFEVAPVFSLIETEVIKKICNMIGYENGDGIFSPGGSISNMYGMVLARYNLFPDIKEKGLNGLPPLVVFTSEESHYSIKKSAHWIGIGTDNHVTIRTNDLGQMLIGDLKEKIIVAKKEGKIPLLVNATAGTTVLGAFDNFDLISMICNKYNLWLHVDACHGGGAILSRDNKHLVKGIEKANSIAWDPHKALGVPLQCAIFLCKESNLLAKCNGTDAKYLFQQDKFYDVSYDTGNKSIQCGRKIDAFKFWFMIKARGLSTFRKLIDNSILISRAFAMQVKSRNGFRLVQDDFQYTNVCFWYIPKVMRNQSMDTEWWKKLYTVAPKIKESMVKSGTLMVGYSPLAYRDVGNFFRMVFTCFPIFEESDLSFMLDKIEELGENIDL